MPLEYFDLHAVCALLRTQFLNAAGEPPEKSAGPALAKPLSVRIDDLSILRELVPPADYRAWMDGGYRELFRLTFALRRQLGCLSLIAHAHVLEHTGAPRRNEHIEAMEELLCCSVERAFGTYRDLVIPAYWHGDNGAEDLFPVIGTSALGGHLLFARSGTCRAFNPYTGEQCTASTQDLFCDKHVSESWWMPSRNAPPSTFAQMSLFYAVVQNAESFDENDLEQMVGEFWVQYAKTTRIDAVTPKELEQAVRDFGVTDTNALRAEGLSGLKRMFFQRALEDHPDVGGSTERFIALKISFELLKRWIST